MPYPQPQAQSTAVTDTTLLYSPIRYLNGLYNDGDVVLFDSLSNGKPARWVFFTGNRSTADLGVIFDPQQAATITDQGSGVGTGLLLKRVRENESEWWPEHYGWRTDNGVTENGAILNHVIAQIPFVESNVTGNTNSMSKTGNHRIFNTRTAHGNRAKIDVPVIIPTGKNIVFDSILGSFDVDALSTTGAGDFWLTVMSQAQGAVVGIERHKMSGAGIDFRGSTNGKGMTCRHLHAEQTRAAVVRIIDQYEVDNPGVTTTTGRPGGSFNVTQWHFYDIEAHGCERTFDLRATTYLQGKVSDVRSFGSVRSPIWIKCNGVLFEDMEFIGVDAANYATDAFIHLDPDPYHPVSDIYLRGVNRIGSEDTKLPAGTGTVYQPPAQNILIGNANTFDGSESVKNLDIDTIRWGDASSSNDNDDTNPVLYGLKIMTSCRDLKIDNSAIQSDIDAVVYEGYSEFNGNVTQCVWGDKNHTPNNFYSPIFSHGGMGWMINNPHQRTGSTEDGTNYLSTTYSAAASTLNLDATNKDGVPNSAYRLTSTGTGTGYITTGGGGSLSKGRLAIGFWARGGQSASGRNFISWRVFESGNTSKYVNGINRMFPITSDWRWYSYPVGQLSETDIDARVRLYAPRADTANGQTQGEIEFDGLVLVSGEVARPN